jgi:hypothetical protein
MYKEKIIDIQSGEETWRDYTSKEVAEMEKYKTELESKIKEIENRQLARQSALSKLSALGLDEAEVAALLG